MNRRHDTKDMVYVHMSGVIKYNVKDNIGASDEKVVMFNVITGKKVTWLSMGRTLKASILTKNIRM